MKHVIIVNLITTIRIIIAIALYSVYLQFGSLAVACLVLFAYLTEFIDGKYARKFNCTTFFGALYDALADKIFNLVCLLILFDITKLAIVLIIFELFIIIINYLRYDLGHNIKSVVTGKIKMFAIAIFIVGTFVIDHYSFIYDSNIFLIIYSLAIVFEILSFSNYLTHFFLDKNVSIKKKKNNLKGKLFDHKFYEKNKNKSIKKITK